MEVVGSTCREESIGCSYTFGTLVHRPRNVSDLWTGSKGDFVPALRRRFKNGAKGRGGSDHETRHSIVCEASNE